MRLEPLKIDQLDGLCRAGLNPDLWHWTVADIRNREDMEEYIDTALSDQSRGVSLPFVTVDKESGEIAGSTRFGNIDQANRKTEIGWTWINPRWQRTHVNTEAKFLMLTHAFEKWNCVRVELKTDSMNQKSRKAILRIGATEEGILRRHMITESGRFRDSVYFSIIDDEWPAVKSALIDKLNQNPQMKILTLLVFFSVLSIFFSGCQSGESSSEASKANRTANSASNGPGTVTQSVPGAPDANGNNAAGQRR